MGQTVNLLVYTFGGSNPSSPTTSQPNPTLERHRTPPLAMPLTFFSHFNFSVMEPLLDIKDLLDCEAARINSSVFIDNDPVQFPRRFQRQQDIEIIALLSATIAWGNRKMICRNCEKMIRIFEGRPYDYLMDEAYETLPDGNIHRTFFVDNLRHYLRGLRLIYSRYSTLEAMAVAEGVHSHEMPAWRLVEAMNRFFAEANGGISDCRCLPGNLRTTALKRINMALRWLVRDDGIVDIGIWKALRPSQLFIPMDVHVADTSRNLGLLQRRSNDREAVIQLTSTLRRFRPDDPVIYDFALFGIGMGL